MFVVSPLNSSALNTSGVKAVSLAGDFVANSVIIATGYKCAYLTTNVIANAVVSSLEPIRKAGVVVDSNVRAFVWNDNGLTTVHAIHPVYAQGSFRTRAYGRALANTTVVFADLFGIGSFDAIGTRSAALNGNAVCFAEVNVQASLNKYKRSGELSGSCDILASPKYKFDGNSYYTVFATVEALGASYLVPTGRRINREFVDIFGRSVLTGNEVFKPRSFADAYCEVYIQGIGTEKIKAASGITTSKSFLEGYPFKKKLTYSNIDGIAIVNVYGSVFFCSNTNVLGTCVINGDSKLSTLHFPDAVIIGNSNIEADYYVKIYANANIYTFVNIEAILRANASSQATTQRTLYVTEDYRNIIVPYENREIKVA